MARVFVAGDVFLYERGFMSVGIRIFKEFKLCAVDGSGIPTFRWTGNKEQQEFKAESWNMLERSILDDDGRVKKANRTNGNSWKVITLYRKNASVGKVWKVRLDYYNNTLGKQVLDGLDVPV